MPVEPKSLTQPLGRTSRLLRLGTNDNIVQLEEKSVRLALQENGICCKFKFKCTFWKLRDCKQKYFCIEKKIRLEKLLSPAAENQNQNGQKPGKLNLSQFVLVLKKQLNRTEASTFTPGRYQE